MLVYQRVHSIIIHSYIDTIWYVPLSSMDCVFLCLSWGQYALYANILWFDYKPTMFSNLVSTMNTRQCRLRRHLSSLWLEHLSRALVRLKPLRVDFPGSPCFFFKVGLKSHKNKKHILGFWIDWFKVILFIVGKIWIGNFATEKQDIAASLHQFLH